MVNLKIDGRIRLLQITDTHLNAPEDGHLLGMKTLHSLACVLDEVEQHYPEPDLLLVTGDLSQDGSVDSYHHLQRQLQRFTAPSFWLAGNHDDVANMSRVAAPAGNDAKVLRTAHWQIVLLNTQVPGKVYGELAVGELDFLRQQLQDAPELHTLVAFHHHPITMGSDWIDHIGIRNADQLTQLIDGFNNVRCLLWGHVHQTSDTERRGVRYLSTPSTCVQFEPGSEDFSIDRNAPGFRWLDLYPDGRIETGVKRVEHIEFEVDYSVKGY